MKVQRAPAGSIVEVQWQDSNGRSGWGTRENYEEWAEAAGGYVHYSVGYVLWNSDLALTVLQSKVRMHKAEESVDSAMCIPWVAITNFEIIRDSDGEF